jgi:DUF3102 family protein
MDALIVNEPGTNRLPVLAADIQRAHAGIREAAKAGTEYAIEAGRALLEAKALLQHGQWLPWLRQHCRLPERTAQLYMHIAELVDEHGLKSATVADMGIRFAGQLKANRIIESPGYDPFAHVPDDESKRQWLLFMLFGQHPNHVEWILQRQFLTPDEWLGEVGTQWRRSFGYPRQEIGAPYLEAWAAFQQKHAGKTLAETLEDLAGCHGDPLV